MIVIQNHDPDRSIVAIVERFSDGPDTDAILHRVTIPARGSEQIHFKSGTLVAVCFEEEAEEMFGRVGIPKPEGEDAPKPEPPQPAGDGDAPPPETASEADAEVAASGEDTNPEANVSESASGPEGGTVDNPTEERPDHEVR